MTSSSTTFEVDVKRNSLGLGFSIMGGPDAPHPYTNLIRIKKVFPLQPAWECGQLRPGDVLLKVDDSSLVSLTLRGALDVLRTSRPLTRLTVFRPPENRLESLFNNNSASPETPQTGGRDQMVNRSYSCNVNQDFAVSSRGGGPSSIGIVPCTKRRFAKRSQQEDPDVPSLDESVQSFGSAGRPVCLDSSQDDLSKTWTYGMNNHQRMASDPTTPGYPLKQQTPFGEFSVTLKKVNGSLGFAISQTVPDTTVMRHSVKALVKEPAVSDGRIQPGDKLIAANGIQLSNFSHAELIAFLRQCPDEVELKLYRDASRSQTPISPSGGAADPSSGTGVGSSSGVGIFAKSSKATQSHPNLPSFLHGRTTSNGSSGKRLLRHEAKEMVKSLQASRTSLDSGNASRNASNASAASARIRGRLGQPSRPYSPKNTKHPLLLSEVQRSFDDDIDGDQPIVETPTSSGAVGGASASAAPPDFFSRMERLHIEELPPTPPTGSTEDFDQMEVAPPPPEAFSNLGPPKPRPRNLDLLANKRSHLYVFHNNCEQK